MLLSQLNYIFLKIFNFLFEICKEFAMWAFCSTTKSFLIIKREFQFTVTLKYLFSPGFVFAHLSAWVCSAIFTKIINSNFLIFQFRPVTNGSFWSTFLLWHLLKGSFIFLPIKYQVFIYFTLSCWITLTSYFILLVNRIMGIKYFLLPYLATEYHCSWTATAINIRSFEERSISGYHSLSFFKPTS